MSNASILNVIQHYQRSIEKCQTDEARLLHCVSKLYKLPVEVEHLQETGIGKTVNALRKFDGEIGSAAKALVAKWKAMVASEEEPMETSCQQEGENSNGKGGENDDDDQYDQNRNKGNNEYDHHNQHSDTTKTIQPAVKEPEPSSLKNENKSKEQARSQHSSSRLHHKSVNANTREEASSSKHKHSHSSSSEKKRTERHHKSQDSKVEKSECDKQKKQEGSERKKESRHKSSSSSRHHKSSTEPKVSAEDHHLKKAKHSEDAHKESERSKSHSNHEKRSRSATRDKERGLQKDSLETHKSTSKERDRIRNKKKDSAASSSSTSVVAANKIKSPSTPNISAPASNISTERKRQRHNSGHDSSTESKSSPQIQPINKKRAAAQKSHDKGEEEDFIDSSMGANFADVLGMLNVPAKKSKKTAGVTKSPSVNAKSSPSKSAKSSSAFKTENKKSKDLNGIKSTESYSDISSSRSTDLKPDLLSSSAKLEPLDPNIALALPTISTNYRPMPLNQTVMECVFASSSSTMASKVSVRTLADDDALTQSISSKTMRTKIYSGVKTGQLMQVPTLFDLCIRMLQRNIDALEYTGGVPFEVLRPVLERASPQQLLVFEEYNPYLMEDSDALWQQHVQRHYRAQKRKEMESWREMFLRCQDDQERKLNILAESIKQSQKIIAAPVRKTQMAFIDSMVKPPRNVLRKQEQYGTKSQLIATPAARVASLSSTTPNAVKTGDARLRIAASVRDNAQVSNLVRPKKAPLMAKTLQLMRGRHKR